jgi:hypothetical protein
MRLLRGLLGGSFWILGALLGLLGVVLCLTVILLPLGIPLLAMARRLLTRAVALMLPRALTHPVDEATTRAKKAGRNARATSVDVGKKVRKLAHATYDRVG